MTDRDRPARTNVEFPNHATVKDCIIYTSPDGPNWAQIMEWKADGLLTLDFTVRDAAHFTPKKRRLRK